MIAKHIVEIARPAVTGQRPNSPKAPFQGRKFRAAAAVGFAALCAAPAMAYLGSFTPNDGYSLSVYTGSANWCDVTYYNAGGYGPNAGGGGGPTGIVPDSGKWKLISNSGGFFTSAAARSAAVGGAPPYPSSVPSNTQPAYIVGAHFPGRNGDGYNLAVRNDTAAGTGPIVYDYALDSYDMGGSNPASITSGTVSTQFYFMPSPGDPPNVGVPPRPKFSLSFRDSLGNTGLEWGYGLSNEVYWRTNGPWIATSLTADMFDWDGLKVDIDLTSDTFGMDYYIKASNTWVNLAPTGTALGAAMLDLTDLRWQLEDAINAGIGGKNFFDDFSFTPEPCSAVLCLTGLLFLRRR